MTTKPKIIRSITDLQNQIDGIQATLRKLTTEAHGLDGDEDGCAAFRAAVALRPGELED